MSKKSETRVVIDQGDIVLHDVLARHYFPREYITTSEGKCRHVSTVTSQRHVMSGTVQALMERLSVDDPVFVCEFLATYRSLMDPPTLFDRLVERYNQDQERSRAVLWICSLLDLSWTEESVVGDWSDGVVLCQAMNSLFPGILTNCILEPENREQKIENVSLFLKVAREVGVTDPQLFECEALVDGTDLHSVYGTLHALASVAWELGAAPFHIVDRNSCRDVLSVFEMWLSQFWNDFMDATGPAVSEMIAAFVRNQLKALNENKPDNLLAQPLTLVLKAHATMKARLAQAARLTSNSTPALAPPSQAHSKADCLDSYPAHVVAEQLTARDARLHSRLMMHECMDTAWQKKDKATRAPTVLTTIAFFNEVAEFAMTCIVQCMHPVARLKAMTRLIDIMVELLMLHNLSSAKAILAALQSTPVYRLKQTWMSLSKDAQKVFDECAMLLSEENNMAQMRKLLDSWDYPKLPYIGMYLSDLAYIDAAYDDTVETSAVESAGTIKEERQGSVHINWEKKRKEYCALKPIVDSQQHALVLATNVTFDCEFYAQFESIKLLNIDECYTLSLKAEPKEGVKNDVVDNSSLLRNRPRTERELTVFLEKRPKSLDEMLRLVETGDRIRSDEPGETIVPIYTNYGVNQPVPFSCTPLTTVEDIIRTLYERRTIHTDDMQAMLLSPYIDVVVPAKTSILYFRDEVTLHCVKRKRKASTDVMNAHTSAYFANASISPPSGLAETNTTTNTHTHTNTNMDTHTSTDTSTDTNTNTDTNASTSTSHADPQTDQTPLTSTPSEPILLDTASSTGCDEANVVNHTTDDVMAEVEDVIDEADDVIDEADVVDHRTDDVIDEADVVNPRTDDVMAVSSMITVCLMKPKGVMKVALDREKAGVVYKSIVVRCNDTSTETIHQFLKKLDMDPSLASNYNLWHVTMTADNKIADEKQLRDAETALKYTSSSPYFYIAASTTPVIKHSEKCECPI